MNSFLGRLAPGLTAKLNLLADLTLLSGAVLLATMISRPFGVETVWAAVAALCAWIITATALRHYDPWSSERALLDDAAMVSVLVMAVATVLAVVAVFAPDDAAAPKLGHFLLVLWPLALLTRLCVFRSITRKEDPLDEVVVLGAGPLGRATADDLVRKGKRRVLGFLRFADEPKPDALPSRLLGAAKDLESILRTIPVSEVYIAGNPRRHGDEMQQAVKTCERLGVPFALPASSFRLDRAQPLDRRAVADGYLHFQSVRANPTQLALKRLFDIIVSATAIWLLLPLFAVVAAAIKLTSRGPVFFKQQRVGLHGRPFHMLKFRSMVVNAEELKAKLAASNQMDGPVFKIKNDPRVTKVGRFIRKYSIDELPQLINVLRGDMSIVGPRPPVPSEVAKYESWQRRRLSVRPGLTCIWQVSGRNQISFEQWMYMDMQYIDHWSFARDLRLIVSTVPVVITGRGAS